MGLAEAMRLAAEHSCELYRDAATGRWVVASVSYDSDACSLTEDELLSLTAERFVADYIPERL